ncbi:MAG: hypothetical protein ABJE47_20980 [bacterium]
MSFDDELRAAPPAANAWRRWLDTENLGLALTLAYLFLSGVGMLHRALVFLRFRINVLDYAEPSDFLLAALRDPLIVLASVAPLPLVWLYFRLAMWLRNKFPGNPLLSGGAKGREFTDKHRSKLFALTVVLWALAFSMDYARRVADDLRAGRGRRVQVDLVAGALHAPSDTSHSLLIGTTQKYLFLLDDRTGAAIVIPTSNVAQVRYEARKKK